MRRETQTLESELSRTFEELRGRCGAPKALEYFFQLAKKYFGLLETPRRNEALIFGSSFPEELLWANHIFPHWIIGGSLSVSAAIDSRVPRDADAISRSMFGYLEDYLANTDSETPIMIPITGDNQRKIAYLLQNEERHVLPIDIAPEAEAAKRNHALAGQLSAIMADLTFAWNMPGEAKKLLRSAQTVERAKASASALFTSSISGMLKMFLLNTYFYAENLAEWSQNLSELAEEIQAGPDPDKDGKQKPGVLIVGAPVLFPNYKVPILLENSGLSILGACDCISAKLLQAGAKLSNAGRDALLYELVKRTYDNDCSGAFVSNRALYVQASRLLDMFDVQGVIFHIIKGQIEYDFELEHMEQLFSQRQIPVFRLETDYHDNDVEQLRIRLEAFAELLMQDVDQNEKSSE